MIDYLISWLPASWFPTKERPVRLSRATILNKNQLPSAVAYEDEANIFTATQTVRHDNGLEIKSTDGTYNGKITATFNDQLQASVDNGFVVANTAGTNTVALKATGAVELTMSGSLVIKRDGGLTIQNNTGTNSVAITATGTNTVNVAGIVDFAKNQTNNFTFENRTSDISSPVEGLAYWQSTEDELNVYSGASWKALSDKKQLLTAQPSSGSYTGTAVTLTAGDSVNFGDACYINSSGQAKLADADAAATANVTVVALETISASSSGKFLVSGTLTHTTNISITAGAAVYLSTTGTTGNTLTATKPSGTGDIVQVLGWGIATNTILWQPNLVQVEIA